MVRRLLNRDNIWIIPLYTTNRYILTSNYITQMFQYRPFFGYVNYPEQYQINEKKTSKKLTDPKVYLNKALYYYYNQNPNFNPYLKPCAYTNSSSEYASTYGPDNHSYYDHCPEFYYNVCGNKICPQPGSQ